MGSGTTAQPGMDQSVTNTGLSNAFLSNQPIPQTYTPMPMPTNTGTSYANLAAPGSLPGLTGSLIGSGGIGTTGMPALPKPSGPMPIPAPVAPVNNNPAQALQRGQFAAPAAAQSVYDKMYQSVGAANPQLVKNTPTIWGSPSHRTGGR